MREMFCGKCGNQLSDHALFCGKCGNKIENPKVNRAKSVKRKGLVSEGIMIAICVIVLGVIGFVLMRPGSEEAPAGAGYSAGYSGYSGNIEIELNDKGQIIKVCEKPSTSSERRAYFDYTEDGKLSTAVLEEEGLKKGIKTEVDAKGNVIRKIEYENGKIKTDTTYDQNGNKIEEKTYGDADENESGHHIGWKLIQCIKREFNSENICINEQEYNSQGILETDVRCDERGNATYLYDLVEEGEGGSTFSVQLDGTLKSNVAEEDYTKEYKYVNSYSADGTLSRIETYDVNGNFYAGRSYFYQNLNDTMVCTQYAHENENHFTTWIEKWDFDEWGNRTRYRYEIHYEGESQYRYREDSYELSYEENTIVRTAKRGDYVEGKYEYIFDNNGGMIKKSFDDDGKLISLSEYKGVEYMRIPYVQDVEAPIYDTNDIEVNPGILVKETKYGENDEGETIEITEYDEEGNEVKWIRVDSEGASCRMYYDTISLPLILSGEMSVDSDSNLLGIYYANGDYDKNTGVFTPAYEWIYDKDNTIVGKRDKESGREIKYRYHYEDERHFTIYEDK